ncbi:SIS domain-containing protein [Salinibacterium sp.]|uniref:SIS domain-containing protein n=1 Tax=Salinibacterium sp. TaxID=1915057 RepID=UPI00286ABDFF|nr:SIS domain-containing protein [Salinibacterium sp.]
MSATFVEAEITSQPGCWREASTLVAGFAHALPIKGERVAIVGCGTSWFIAMSFAVLRETAGDGETDAFAGSEFPMGRKYDRVIAISRSGTTTEIIALLDQLGSTTTVLITAVPESPAAAVATHVISLPFADEKSIVQTRFATTTLSLLRAHLGDDIEALAQQGEEALHVSIRDLVPADQVTFLGLGWAVGLAQEAALKTREAAQFWAEAYPAMDYRHGPVAIAQSGRLVWSLGGWPAGLEDDVSRTGARFVNFNLDAQAALVVVQRFAVALAEARGLDPDHPRNLTRSVILPRR